jgi:hypothetical protein
MAMGQAAGAAAALAAMKECSPIDLNINEIKQLLVEYGAIVPEE